ncbi:restriction endonuclease subunit S [Algoriphagus chordae]|uniref:Type I restriction enzyme S subunit n=1 Tax=Algoriphagus chordae TaxID=237019 RepID=A0A2W7QZL3_9BACT|nr:restriction endonuclease subunit S [Algoriphagus chordae]PZX53993.1 type I restriction enzyme S subunit [Algoriphagus chordae]
MSEWEEIGIGELATFRNGAGIKQEYFSDMGVKLARVSDFTDDSIDISKCNFVSKEHAIKWKSHFLNEGDVVVATVGSWPPNWSSAVGKVIRIPKALGDLIQNQNTCCIIPDNTKLDNRFLFYILRTIEFRWFAGNSAGGSANQARLPVAKLKQFKTLLPPLSEQKAIAHILGKLDDKIALNRRMNQTLEAMAQALFKSWFVDFDPVLDNALAIGNEIPEELEAMAEKRRVIANRTVIAPARRGGSPDEGAKQSVSKRLIDTNPALAAQFPSSFVFNETLGKWIPEGWEVKRAEEISKISIGKTPPRKEQHWFEESKSDSNFIWVSIKTMGTSGMYISDSDEYLTAESVAKFNVNKVPSNSVILSFKMTVGRVAITTREMCTNEAIAHFSNLKDSLFSGYIYLCLKNFDYDGLGSTSSIATAVNSKLIKQIPFLVPKAKVLNKFKKSVSKLNERILVTQNETENLTQLRDALLPELISGRVRVKVGYTETIE